MSEEITQAQMDKYFETGGKEAPPALVEAEKVEAEAPVETPSEQPKEAAKPDEPVKEAAKPDGEVQVNVEGKMVPLAELMAERKERQAWQSSAAQQQQQLTETLAMLKERAKLLPPEEQAKAPDPNQDPQGYAVWEYEQHKKQVAELSAWRQEQAQREQANTRTQQVLGWAQNQSNVYVKTVPDYPKAVEYARELREKELEAIGYTDPAVRSQIVEQDIAQIVQVAAQKTSQGVPTNPAELIYNYAKAKGYKAEIIAQQKTVPDLDDKVRTISKGQEAARGVSQGAGGAPSEINSLQDLAAASGDMDDDEFSKAFDKLAGKMKGKYV